MTLLSEHTDRIGYLLKDRVVEIETLTDASTPARASSTPPSSTSSFTTPAAHPLAALTDREREVLALIAEGRHRPRHRETLWITPKTAETHARNIFRKLDLPSTVTENRRVHAVLAFLGHPPTS